MIILISVSLLLLGGLLNFIREADGRAANILGRVYLFLVCIAAVSSWVLYFAGIKNAGILDVLSVGLQYVGYAGHFVFGYLMGHLALRIRSTAAPAGKTTLWAMSIAVSNSFILATVGKSVYMDDMVTFFRQSGYAIWFLYFIMAAESAGAIGILLNPKLKTGIPAAIGLILIMLGAVYTHWHNNDPFSDSYAAVMQVINLSLLLWLYALPGKTPIQLSNSLPDSSARPSPTGN